MAHFQIVPIIKPDNSVCICGDYKQTVNKASNCDKYPVPRTEDLFTSPGGGEKFTKLDLSHIYQQLLLNPESCSYLTINTHKRLFQPTQLQFGVNSVSGIFQREIENLLKSVPFVKVRSEHILLLGKNNEEHLKTLDSVLRIILENGLKLKLQKCVFMQPEATYLGYRINKDGIFPLPEKIDFIKNAKSPKSVTELKSYLELINYCHHHLPSFSTILESLHKLLRKYEKWPWGGKEEQAFQKSKSLLYSSNLLIHYDPEKPMIIACDTSPYGLGAVLSHIMPNKSERPIMFTSRTLTNAERNYSQIEKEALAVIFAVKKFHQYIYGQTVMIQTDHILLLGLLAEQ